MRHPRDRKCVGALETYATCLRPGSATLIDRPLDTIAKSLALDCPRDTLGAWWRQFERRYVDLSESEAAVTLIDHSVSK